MLSLLLFVIALCFVAVSVVIHECGHWLGAKILGFRVRALTVGTGRKMFRFKAFGTFFRISKVPFSGAVHILGVRKKVAEPTTLRFVLSFTVVYLSGALLQVVFAATVLLGMQGVKSGIQRDLVFLYEVAYQFVFVNLVMAFFATFPWYSRTDGWKALTLIGRYCFYLIRAGKS